MLARELWFIVTGLLFVTMAVVSPRLGRVPLSAPVIYIAVGIVVGPTALGYFDVDVLGHTRLLETVAEVAMLVSLYAAGAKMPMPFSFRRWRAPLMLGSVGMAITAAALAGFGHYAFGLPIGAAVLLGGILAPTDPVLATEVESRHAGDRDPLRFTLTCEAGINDGAVLPVVLLGLGLLGSHELGAGGSTWIGVDLLYKTAVGVALGVAIGWLLGRLTNRVQSWRGDAPVLQEFLALGLVALSFGLAELIAANGFLAVFAAAAALRCTELKHKRGNPESRQAAEGRTAELDHTISSDDESGAPPEEWPIVSETALEFEQRIARVSEVLLVLLIGALLPREAWTWQAVAFAAFLFFVARPFGVWVALLGSKRTRRTRWLAAWFGLRGIGSLYYVMYSLEQGIPAELGAFVLQTTLVIVALSITLHGISVTPLVKRYTANAPPPI